MNIVLGEENICNISQKYVALELDTIRLNGEVKIKSYCVVEKMSLNEMVERTRFEDLHARMMKNYRLRNWDYCTQAIEHLYGRWGGELDSFYTVLLGRINTYKEVAPADDWDGSIERGNLM